MKTGVLTLLDTLHLQGAENVAVNIAINLKNSEHYSPFVCITRKGGILEEKLQEHNIQYIILERNHFYEIHKFTPVSKLIKDNNIKLLHAHKIGSNLWASLISRYFQIPAIAHYHGYDYEIKKTTHIIANKIIGILSFEIVAVSELLRQNLIKSEGINPSKITTIHNGINYNQYQIKPKYKLKKCLGIKLNSPVVGIVGALTEVKNHALFIKSARQILNQYKNVYFLIAGKGPERNYLQRLAVELGINDKCIFTGFRQDIPDILSIIDIGVLTSHSEGLPLALLEYMASSKPVVTTDVGGVSELVEDKINGFLVPPGDYETLAQKIGLLIENTELAHEMGLNGFNRIKENFSEEIMMQKIQHIYKKVLSP